MNSRKKSLYVFGILSVLLFAALLFPFSGGAAPDLQSKQQGPQSKPRELPNYDAFGAGTKRSAAASQNDLQNPNQPQSEGGHLVQSETRLGVPTFLWASDPGPARSLMPAASQTDGGGGSELESAARSHLDRYGSRYRLSNNDVAAAKLAAIHDTGKGAIIVKFKQEVGGFEVFRDEINVIMNRDLQLLALSGYLTGANDGAGLAGQDFKLTPADAVSKAIADLTGTAPDAAALKSVDPAGLAKEQNSYLLFTADGNAPTHFAFAGDPARVKQVMYHLIDEYVPAYYIEADVLVPSTDGNILTASGEPARTELAYAYVISAVDGQLLFRGNLMADVKPGQKSTRETNLLAPGGFTYRVWADPVTGVPYDTPAGNGVHPKLIAFPDGAQAPFLSLSDVTLPNYPFSQNDPWLAPGATQTLGNNVDAFLNLFSPDGLGNPVITTPTEPPTGDFRAQITSAGQFLNTHIADGNTASAAARQGAIQQLFYNVNFLHDWFYDAGFNEASGNAQTNNYGRGGLQNDSIKAQAQDYSGFSNANMLTPADGAQPRMRMYVFPSPTSTLDLQAPASIVASPRIGVSMSGPQTFDITADIVKATFSNSPSSCTITNAAALNGKLALFDFDNTDGTGCSFSTRISRITATGAVAMIMAYTSGSPTLIANITGFVAANSKPVATIAWNSSTPIKTELSAANTVTARLYRAPDRDGTVDNQIVSHEWGHYISNRLIGNGSGLNTNMAGGMGEGWGDFTAMLALTVRADDTGTPSNATWNGAYALATYATGAPSGVNNSYYFGIRRYPYSTDMAIDPLTFKHVQNGEALPIGPPVAFGQNGATNSEVHNTGEVWTTMLWECYAALLRDTQGATPRLTFAEAQDRMRNYLVASYKMTPASPTFMEARDAVLAAAFAYDYEDGRLFGQAFAKRGAGINAISPDRYSATNVGVTESFDAGAALSYVSSTLDDSVDNCDADGYLDTAEKGLLKVTIKNNGFQNLFNTTATVSSNNQHVSFPDGTNINFGPTQPGQNVTASLVVAANGVAGIEESNFSITFQDSGSPAVAPVTVNWIERLNVDEISAVSSMDFVEARSTVWSTSGLSTLGSPAMVQWRRTQDAGSSNHGWFAPDPYVGSDQMLTGPIMTVDGSGSLNLQFDHSWGFEFDGGGNYDGGVVEMSVNGGAFTDIGGLATGPVYNGTILNYSGSVNPLKGRPGFVKNSAGTVHASLTQANAPGSTVQIRFRVGSDSAVGSTGWRVDNIAFTGTVETPFNGLSAEVDTCHPTPNPTPVIISLSPSTLPAGTVGTPYSVVMTPSGGTGPYSYTTTPVVLSQGFSSSVVNGNLQISGTPTKAGAFLFTVNTSDSASHSSSTNYTVTINKGTPVITWNNPVDITYPAALSGTQLNATTSIPGVLTYTPPATTVLNAGNSQTLSVSFVPTDTANYNNASQNVAINVLKPTPTITWTNPADITYPTALSSTELNATASVAGTLTYTQPVGTVLNAGDLQTLTVNFAPADSVNYSETSRSVRITVRKATSTITWNNPADIAYPTALSATQLNATASVPGTLTYTPATPTVMSAGNAQTLSVNFVPTDSANYENASKNVSLNVLKATPTITWVSPADITYPTALSALQLNAAASVPGILTYTPSATTVLNAGSAQTLSVNFVPTDSTNYNNAAKDVTINVLKATSTITWNNPADILYPTALSGTQLNATVNGPGTLTYTPPATTVLNAGDSQTLSVTFVPANTTNYSSASKDVSINVLKVTPAITWSNPADITYPAALSATQLNATASVPGVLTYTPPATTVLNAGNAQTLSVSFVPADTANYNSTSKNVSINVAKVTPVITWSNPADITYPTALTAIQLNATASVPGVLTYAPLSGTVLNAGAAQNMSVNFVPADVANYSNASTSVSINVLKGTPTITWSNPVDITYPAALSATQLNATASVPGVLTYTPPAPTVLAAGNAQILSVSFSPADTSNYQSASQEVQINVLTSNQTITFGALSNRPLSSTTFNVAGTSSSNLPLSFAILSGPATINAGVVTVTDLGPVTVRASQAGDANYNAAIQVDQTFMVTQGGSSILVVSSLNPTALGEPVTFTATINSSFGAPTGTVTFKDAANIIGFGTLNDSGVVTIITSALSIGTHMITAEYSGDANNRANSATVSGGQVVSSPASGVMQFSSANYSVGEPAGSIAITVTRTGNITAAASVDYVTDDGGLAAVSVPCSATSGSALERCDFTRAVGTLQFAAGQASTTFVVLTTDDSYVEGAETLKLILSNPGPASLLEGQTTATLTIIDDDILPSSNPVDNAGAFVAQLYHDFLNRTPDSAGLIFWTNQITSCGSDQVCISEKRVNVAAAFFLSIEFQQTGYLVERLYKTGYGSSTGSSTLGGAHALPVPVIRFGEFLPDTQKIGLGVLVGQAGWEAVLDHNKAAFVDEFVLRTRFTTAYPNSMTNTGFVDTLNTNAGNPLSVGERNQLISELNGMTKTRAQVLRAIAEHPALFAAESNRAFVLMQYFGFLRRNPDELPDADYTGSDFWLTKLNQFNGNFVNAEMSKSFISSEEYRKRFGN